MPKNPIAKNINKFQRPSSVPSKKIKTRAKIKTEAIEEWVKNHIS